MPSGNKILSLALILCILFSLSPADGRTEKESLKDSSKLTYLILSGQFQQALNQLPSAKKLKKKGDWKNRLIFMSAYLNLQKGNFKEAAKLFKQLQKDYDILKDYVAYYRALSLRESGKTKEALELLKKLKIKQTSPHLSQKINRQLAIAYCKTGDRGAAIEMFNEMIQTGPSDIMAYHLRFDRSLCLIRLGSPQEALITLRALYLNYPEGDLSEEILKTLESIGKKSILTPRDHIQRGEQLMRNQRPALAAADFEAVLKQYGGHAPSTLKKQLAEAYFKSRQYPKAAKVYKELKDRHPGLFDEEAQLRLAQSYARSDQFDKALRAYQTIAASRPASEQSKWDYKIAFIYMDKGDYRKANQLFKEILQKYPKHRRRAQIHWYLAWNHYLLKNYQQAQVYLNRLEKSFPRSRWARRVPYWRARILEKQGNQKAARAAYASIIEKDPFSYYGFLSLKRTEGNWDAKAPPKGSWTLDLPRRSIPRPFSLSRIEPTRKKQVRRVQELLLLGLWEDFLGEINLLANAEGIPYDIKKLQQGLNNQTNVLPANPRLGWERSYPPAYATLVSLFSKTRKFPMALTWAVMREESRFRPVALSKAQALGLMQIIPPTGIEIAEDLNRKGFVPEQLYQPVTNIEFGVHYLSKNQKRFGGNLPQTIASYNAGPDAVERWISARPGRDWDEFIEEIPYRETNNYVKKVLKSYYIYKLMYEGS